MSTSRGIYFLAETKSPMVEHIQTSMRNLHFQLHPKFEPIITKGDNGAKALEMYSGIFVLPNGDGLEFFGGEEVFGNKFKNYNKKFKLWAYLGSSDEVFVDEETGEESFYPLPYFKRLLIEVKKSKIQNDVYMVCTTDSGGYNHRSYPKLRKLWPGKFL